MNSEKKRGVHQKGGKGRGEGRRTINELREKNQGWKRQDECPSGGTACTVGEATQEKSTLREVWIVKVSAMQLKKNVSYFKSRKEWGPEKGNLG